MSCLLIMKIPSLYCNPQFIMKQLGSGRADNGVQCFTDIPLPQFLTLWLVMLCLVNPSLVQKLRLWELGQSLLRPVYHPTPLIYS